MRWTLALLSVLAQSAAQQIGKAYFYLAEGSEKCFVENLPEGAPMSVSYHNRNNPGIVCSVAVKDQTGRVVINREVTKASPKGRLAYMTKSAGHHQTCVSCQSSKWFGHDMLQWNLAVELGDSDINLNDVAKGSQIKNIDEVVRLLKQKIIHLRNSNDYIASQELKYREASESSGRRVLQCALIQTAIMVLTCLLSALHLRRFFKRQKLF